MTTTTPKPRISKQHRADAELLGAELLAEARHRGWCSDYEFFLERVNHRLHTPLPAYRNEDGQLPPPRSKRFLVWAHRLQDEEVWSKPWIGQWMKVYRIHHIDGTSASPGADGLLAEERQLLIRMFNWRKADASAQTPIRVGDAQAQQGRAWLVEHGPSSINRDFTGITHFDFWDGAYSRGAGSAYVTQPQYRAHWEDGHTLIYSRDSFTGQCRWNWFAPGGYQLDYRNP